MLFRLCCLVFRLERNETRMRTETSHKTRCAVYARDSAFDCFSEERAGAAGPLFAKKPRDTLTASTSKTSLSFRRQETKWQVRPKANVFICWNLLAFLRSSFRYRKESKFWERERRGSFGKYFQLPKLPRNHFRNGVSLEELNSAGGSISERKF